MQYRPFGRTGLEVSAIGFGCWPMSADRYGPIDEDEAVQAVRRACEVGINCFDTAPGYGVGHSEKVLGRALGERRMGIILVTKCGIIFNPQTRAFDRDSSRANILREIDASLQRLGTDHVDVLLIHWPDPKTPFDETMRALDEVARSGKVRFVGVSNFSVEQMHACMQVRRVDVLQVGFHLFDRRMEREVFPFCAQHGIGVMAYGSLAHGLLTGAFTQGTTFVDWDWRARGVAFGQPIFRGDNFKQNVAVVDRLKAEVAQPKGVTMAQLALAWVLRNSVVSTALVGARKPSEVEENLGALDVALSDDDLARIDEIMRGAAGLVSTFRPFGAANEVWD